jgi:hypothetical protein
LPRCSVKIEDVKIEENVFVQEGASHEVILGKIFITSSCIKTKVLHIGATSARIWSKDVGRSSQFFTITSNHE